MADQSGQPTETGSGTAYKSLLLLQPLLDDLGISSTLARVHYLGLPGRDGSGISTAYEQRQPILFVPLRSGKVLRIRASGKSYVLVTGMSFQADDPPAAAREIALFASAG